MDFLNSDPHNIVGFSTLLGNDNHKSDILDLERSIINGPNLLLEEEENNTDQYKQDMERLTTSFNVGDFSAEPEPVQYYNQSAGQSNLNSFIDENVADSQLKYMTMEQKKQTYVDEVLGDINANDENLEFDIDKERDEDDKNALLEQIDMLRDTLDDDGVNLSTVPVVTKNNSISDIKNIYKILRLKNDRNRYCSFAEELFLSGAYGIEYLFDGKNEYFGRKPDLVGWSNTVRIKLRRCRYQTSTLVKDMMADYNMGPGMQLFFELIPSLFLYSRQKKLANDNIVTDDLKYDEAISNLNDN